MSTNLVSIAMQYITPEMIGRFASALGIDRRLISQAVSAAIPALIGSFAGIASKPGGAATIDAAVRDQNPSILDDISEMIEGGSQQDLIQTGNNTLKTLLGPSSVPSLASAIGKFAGMSQNTSSSLLGMLAPAVLGILGKQKEQKGLDASGMARLLSQQKQHVSEALPAGFANYLKGVDIPGLAAPATPAREKVAHAAFSQPKPAPKRASPSLLTWLLPIAAIAAAAWWFLGDRATTVTEAPVEEVVVEERLTANPEQVATGPVRLLVGGVDLSQAWDRTFSELRTTLEGVSDVETARSALPKLQDAAGELERLAQLSEELPPAGRTALARLVDQAQPRLEQLYEKVLAIPGVAEIAQPRIEVVRTQLNTLSQA
jgi:hypothetical protein